MERKLTAILSADVKGYSRLMGEDEEATIRTLTAYRAIMTTRIQQQRGRVVDAPGDNLLAEFASLVDAVRCAVEIQQELKVRNAELPDQRKMEFRIGLNLGDVVVEGERLYGDGVNIAARLESLAEPGGICISGTVYEHVENKLALTYEYLGEQTVKNIAKPVRVWRILPEPQTSPPPVSKQASSPVRTYWQRGVWSLLGVLLILGVVVAIQYLSFRPPAPSATMPPEQALPLPDKPSIAVLPFVNMSGDSEQEHFSNGITEDLTTELAKLSSLFVIARTSAFVYKGKTVDVKDVSRGLGVRYILEGSVRKAGDRVRITAQLVDAPEASYLWAESYDRELKDVFAVQDEIKQQVIAALKVKLPEAELARVRRTPTDNMTAYDYLLRGSDYFSRFTKETNAQARQMYEKALALDPQYAQAYASVGWSYSMDWTAQWSEDPQVLEQIFVLAQKALALDNSLANAHLLLGWAWLFKKHYDQALGEVERCLELDPNDAFGYAWLGSILNSVGRPEEAISMAEKALRLNPRNAFFSLTILGSAYGSAGQREEAVATLKKAINANPTYLAPHLSLAAIYSQLGRGEEARAEAAEVLRISPNFSLEVMRQSMHSKDPAVEERTIAALRKAGLK